MPYINQGIHRFLLGIHRAFVVDRNDNSEISDTPNRGRIKVKIPFLTDQENDGEEYHFWCDYCGPSHQFFSIPAVGTLVYVMFNGGNPEQPVWIGAVNTTNLSKDPPQRFRRDEPDVSGYESLGGHFLEFDDISGEKHIRLEDSNANFILMDTEAGDLEVFFANDERRTIGNDRTTDIGNDDFLTVGGDRVQTITGDWDNIVTGDYKATVTSNIDFKATLSADFEGTATASLKNSLFTFAHLAAISSWSSGSTSIVLTPTSITITVGGTSQTWTGAGSTFVGPTYILAGVDHIPHTHISAGSGSPSGPPV